MRRGRVPELGLVLLAQQIFMRQGISNIPRVTLGVIGIQVLIYLQFLVVPRLCLSGESVWEGRDWLRLMIPALRHTHDIHLYYNMVSLASKGIYLERLQGSLPFLVTLSTLTLLSSSCYVLLAVIGSELMEDYSIMRQCAIGFSGVLFALKVVNTQYNPEGRQSIFGFEIPSRLAVWAELVIIQLVVPNSSFLGHLAGILAGLIYIKVPFSWLSGLRTSSFSLLSLPSLSPALFLLLFLQLSLHLGLVPTLSPLTGCLPTRQLITVTFNRISLEHVKYLLLAPLHHLSYFHVGLNLLSFMMKAQKLEPRLGFFRFVFAVVGSIVMTSLVFFVIGRLLLEISQTDDHLSHCTVGLSGPMFALKILTVFSSVSLLDLSLLFEAAELFTLLERNSRLYHVSGLIVGLGMWFLIRMISSSRSFTGEGRRLGGEVGGREGRGRRMERGDQPDWTRSWGYSRTRGEVRGMRGMTPSPYTDYTPSAPPMEEVEGVLGVEGVAAQPNNQSVRPPHYPEGVRPPPPGPGYRIDESHSASITDDELRRRRLERFS